MKKIFNIISVAVLVLMAASCDRKVEFQHETFATFYTNVYNVNEDAGKLTIPVVLYNPTGAEVQFSLGVVANGAEEGKDFEITSPANGILTFSGETDSLTVEIAISDEFVGEFTGGKNFKLQLASITEGYKVGSYNTASVTILDLDHPLAALIGEWEGTLVFADNAGTQFPTTLKMASIDSDETYTKLSVSGLEPAYAQYVTTPLEAVYDKATKILTIPAGQLGMYVNASYDFIFIGLDEAWSNIVNPRFVYDETKNTLTQLDCFGVLDNKSGSIYSAYLPGAVFTKK